MEILTPRIPRALTLLASAALAALAGSGCGDDDVTGEVVFDPPPPSLANAVIKVSVLEVPKLQDRGAKVVGSTVIRAPESSPVSFSISPSSWDESSEYYVDASADVNGNGESDCGDYVDKEFFPVESRDEEVRVVVVPAIFLDVTCP